ncbi:MAG TPA: transposase [Xanthobacteraceae bacterium]|nr:transposase [Xanthobacteraceae bacterium]
MTGPGIGALLATGLIAAAGNGRSFRKAREMVAWPSLVLRKPSSGRGTALVGIGKRGRSCL